MSNEREISIVDLLWRILFGWRFVLALAVICTIIGGLVSYKNYSSAMSSYSASGDSVALSEYDKAQVAMAVQLEKDAKGFEVYLTESLLMNVDPYDLKVATLSLIVTAGGHEEEIVQLYGVRLQEDALASRLAAVMGIDGTKYVRELINVESFAQYLNLDAASKERSISNSSTCIVSVICPESSMYEAVSNEITAYLNDIKTEVADAIGEHELVIASSELVTMADRTLAGKQVSEFGSLAALKTAKDNALNALSASQRAYYDGVRRGESDIVVAPVSPSFSKKYVALGFVLGLFLACAWIACKAIFASKLQNREELESQFHVRMLGSFASQKKYRGLDKLLYKWRHSGEKKLTLEERVDIICSNIAILCEKAGLKNVAITGTCICEANRGLFESIVGELRNKGLSADAEESIIYNTASLKNVTQSGAAVIVEQVDVSKYREIEQELITLKGNDVNVLGCVGIE